MVKRLSVVNLENFRRQYARRRWKVKHRTELSLLYYHKTCRDSFHVFFSNRQLSFRIVALCNHLTRIMKKGHKLPEDGVRAGTCFSLEFKLQLFKVREGCVFSAQTVCERDIRAPKVCRELIKD